MLTTSSLQDALNELGFTPQISLLASRINDPVPKRRVLQTRSIRLCHRCVLTLDWSRLMFLAFPPFSVIPAILSKLVPEKAMRLCIFPTLVHAGLVSKSNTNVNEGKGNLEGKKGSSHASKPFRGDSSSAAQAQPDSLPLIRESGSALITMHYQ